MIIIKSRSYNSQIKPILIIQYTAILNSKIFISLYTDNHMSKAITITLDSLNNLYCKFLENHILHHLPSNVANQVESIINLKSTYEVHNFLNKLIYPIQVSSNNENIQRKTNISVQGSENYIAQDDFRYPYDYPPNGGNVNIAKKSNGPKRTNTYIVKDEATSEQLLNDIKGLNFNRQNKDKQDKNSQKSSSGLAFNKNNYSNGQNNTNNIVKHDYDTISEKPTYNMGGSTDLGKKQNKNRNNEPNRQGDFPTYQFKMKKQLSQQQPQFYQKPQPPQQQQNKIVQEPHSAGMYIKPKQYKRHISQQQESNRQSKKERSDIKIKRVIRNLRQVFRQNQKKIERYENISNLSNGKSESAQGQIPIQKKDSYQSQNQNNYKTYSYSKQY